MRYYQPKQQKHAQFSLRALFCALTAIALCACSLRPYFVDHQIQPGDDILIRSGDFFPNDRLVVVKPNGSISLPLIGTIPAAGHSLDTLRVDIEQRLRPFGSELSVELSRVE